MPPSIHPSRLPAVLLFACMLAVAAPAAAADKLTLVLDWFLNPDHATVIVAEELGYFRDAGLDVEIQAPADPNDPPKFVAAGKADLAISYQPQLHLQVNEGLPLVRIATIVATPLNTLIVLRDGPIKAISDLKGKRVGFSVGGLEEAVLGGMLAHHGLSLKDVELINVNWALSQSLIAGRVDAVVGGYRNFELNQMDIVGRPGRAFYVEEEGVPAYDELILVTNRATLGNAAYPRFIAAVERATQFIVNHPDEAWKLFIRNHKDLDDELNRRAWGDTLPRFALRPAALDERRYDTFAAFLQKSGLIADIPPLETYAVQLR